MKLRHLILPAIVLCLVGCVHEFPEGTTPDSPSGDAGYRLHLDFTTELPPHTEIIYSTETHRSDYLEEDIVVRHQVWVFTTDARADEDYLYHFTYYRELGTSLNTDLRLNLLPGDFSLYVWTDYVKAVNGSDWHYETIDPTDIGLARLSLENYAANTDTRDAFRGAVVLDPSQRDVTVAMERPMAKYRFVSTDLQEFVSRYNLPALSDAPSKVTLPSHFQVIMRYTGFLPHRFNLLTNRPADATTGVNYVGKFVPLTYDEIELASDYVFVNGGEAMVDAAVDLYDTRTGNRLSVSPPVTVPLMRSKITTVRGEFLTSKASGDVGITPDFNGSFDIPF